MGHWGPGPIENDCAGDWMMQLERGGVELIASSLRAVSDAKPQDPLQNPVGDYAIAAAEIVAAMRGRPSPHLTLAGPAKWDGVQPWEAMSWLATAPKPSPELVALAKAATERVNRDSDVQRWWDEVHPAEAKKWHLFLKDLADRLS